MAHFAGSAHWAEPSPVFAHRARATPLKCKNEYLVLPLWVETAVQAVVGSVVWAFHGLKKPRCRGMNARGTRFIACPQLPFSLPDPPSKIPCPPLKSTYTQKHIVNDRKIVASVIGSSIIHLRPSFHESPMTKCRTPMTRYPRLISGNQRDNQLFLMMDGTVRVRWRSQWGFSTQMFFLGRGRKILKKLLISEFNFPNFCNNYNARIVQTNARESSKHFRQWNNDAEIETAKSEWNLNETRPK